MGPKRWVALVIFACVAVVLFYSPAAPGRKVLFLARNAECFKRPHNGSGLAAIGDSVTAGHTDADWGFLGSTSWLNVLVCDDAIPYSYNAGIPGQTTEQIAVRLPALIDRHPDVIVLLAGTNNVLNQTPQKPALGLIDAMIGQLRAAHITPVIGTLPPYEKRPDEVAVFNAALTRLARRRSVSLIDFHRALASGGRYRPGLGADEIHPSAAGARAMAAVALPVVRAALSAKR